jgi:hypothetical protein
MPPSWMAIPYLLTAFGGLRNGVYWHHGSPAPGSPRRANAAAAVAVTRRGPATAPTREEIDQFLDGR